ncbi:MAG: hypothetical protein JXR53_07750 [Bacteroidales bacterium]|nr:hypothetical protein [Bacteroidales bacterium]
MKKLSFLMLFAFMFVAVNSANAPDKKKKPLNAIITYTISYEGDWDPATLAQQPTEQIVKVLGNQHRTEIMSGGANIYIIANGNDSSTIILLDISSMGLKYYMKTEKEKILAEMEDEPKINYLDETKTISGYECKKAEYITTDEYGDEVATVVYYSEELGNESTNFGGTFHGLKGFPMEYSIETEQGTVTYAVTNVQTKKTKIKDIIFMIPTDYEELDEEKAKQLFGGE